MAEGVGFELHGRFQPCARFRVERFTTVNLAGVLLVSYNCLETDAVEMLEIDIRHQRKPKKSAQSRQS